MTGSNKLELEKIYQQVSPFEFKEELLELARNNENLEKILDAGRGNPNWTASLPREAFFTLGQFAVWETKNNWCDQGLSGMPKKKGIAKRLRTYLKDNNHLPGTNLIEEIIAYGIETLAFEEDAWVYELADGIIGCNYPFPDRFLKHVEKIVLKYLMKIFNDQEQNFENWDVFAVEGGTAAMCYLFNSLAQNHLLNKGDKIALMTPIFTPYLEIPSLPNYNFEVVHICASTDSNETENAYQYPKEELDKLKDEAIKAVFIVNPSNPIAITMDEECKSYFVNLVKEYRSDLMIITDDVYGTFVNDFSSLVMELPYNTLCVYSLSKYFGVTGWRLGTIMLHKTNVFDERIKRLNKEEHALVNKRYKHLAINPREISFMDRIVADSRQVALNHTAGLSTPQQVQMAMFCGFELVDTKNNYQNQVMQICETRKQLLYKGLGMELEKNPLDTCYYTELNILKLAKQYANGLEQYIKQNYKPLDFFYKLAYENGVILLRGDGFASSKWGMRVSLANLKDEEYEYIGQTVYKMLEALLIEWKNKNN
ncbi:MAG: aspartate 4-decarboxylase [Cellulosilyticaceae bacterium]